MSKDANDAWVNAHYGHDAHPVVDNKPAAAQEAVAIVKIIGGAAHDFCYLAVGLADGEYSLFAAPVTAAPVDAEELARNRYRPVPDGLIAYRVVAGDGTRSLFSGTKDACNIVARKLTEAFLDGAYVASTPAAPGIDHAEMIKSNLSSIKRLATTLPISHVSAANIVDEANHAITLIDASPKGGSTDAKDAARYRWLRDSSGNAASDTPSTIVMADEGGWDFVFGPDLDKATDAAMQATSAEVGE